MALMINLLPATPSPSMVPTSTPVATPVSTATEQPKYEPGETTFYDDMITSSLIHTGNNERIKKAIDKAQNGKDVTIAFIGGSILLYESL